MLTKRRAAQRRLATGAIAEPQLPRHQRVAEVVVVAVLEQLDVRQRHGLLPLHPKLQDEAVGQIDHVLVGHRAPAHDRRLAVVDTVRVAAGVVHLVGVLPLRRAAQAEVAVAGRGERFAQPLVGRLKAVEAQQRRGRVVALV
jgi:hypothetical protein